MSTTSIDYEVEAIKDKRVTVDGEVQYKVHWVGFSESDDSWEPVEMLGACQDRITEYEERQVRVVKFTRFMQFICSFSYRIRIV